MGGLELQKVKVMLLAQSEAVDQLGRGGGGASAERGS